MKIIEIEEADSTNTAAPALATETPCLVYALRQTAGRGQRGNTWESEPGKNLTASLVFTPANIEAGEQFAISEAVALAVADMLAQTGVEAMVKWPNDIYAGDRKICGILIENQLTGKRITRTVAGMGINVNQTEFLSDAPNPVSVAQLTGESHDIAAAARMLAACLESRLATACSPDDADRERLHEEYMGRLWRGKGYHRFRDTKAGRTAGARIASVAPDGTLTLEERDGTRGTYAFKEVEFIL